MKDTDSAFPVVGCKHYEDEPGMTLAQHAAIKLRVPRSGDPDLDAMIRESRRADFAEKSLIEFASDVIWEKQADYERAAKVAFEIAAAMLAEWGKVHV
jgi:hypothetical protein